MFAARAIRGAVAGLSLSASSPVFGVSGSSPVTTNACTVSVSGGVGPYTYAWAYVAGTYSGLIGTPSALTPTSATCAFRSGTMTSGDLFDADFRCTVLDAVGNTDSVLVTPTWTRI